MDLKVWLGMVLLVCMLAGCSAMPLRPDNIPRRDYTYTKDYISWLARSEMNKYGVTG
jgi:hypothetical protein